MKSIGYVNELDIGDLMSQEEIKAMAKFLAYATG